MKKIYFILIITISIFQDISAQFADCNGAIPVCETTTADYNVNGSGVDDFNGADNSGCLGHGSTSVSTVEANSIWFFFQAAETGQLGFNIIPGVSTDDWDFAVYGPNPECGNLPFPMGSTSATDCTNSISNYSGASGNTGAGINPTTGTQSSAYCPYFNVVAGETYLLLINSFAGTNHQFTLEWTGALVGAGLPNPLDCSVLNTGLGPDQDVCEGTTVTLDGTPTVGTPSGYVWSVDTGAGYVVLTGETNATLDVTTSGTYQVEITDTDGNVATDDVVITFSPIPTASATTSPQQFCVSGAASIDLSLNDATILNGQDNTVYGVAYYASQADADANTGALSNPYSTSVNQTIYAATYNLNNPDCRDTTVNFDLEINQIPTITLPPAIQLCDIGSDGTEIFDLTQLDAGILGSQVPVADFTVSYFTDNTHTTAVTTPTALVVSPTVQTIYPLVINTVTGCASTAIGGIDISLYPLPTATQPANMVACENPAGSGQSDFTLTDQDTAILGAQAAADFTVNYYSDAGHVTQITAMPYTAVDATTIYVQVLNNLCGTTVDTTFVLNVIPPSTVDAINNFTVCNGDTTGVLAFTSPQANVSYTWVNDNTAIGLAASGTGNLPSFTATNTTNTFIEGIITVTPEITVGGLTCQGVPRDFTIRVNPTPTVNAITSPAPYCTGDTTTAITFTGNGVAGTVYNWVNTGDAIGMGAMSGTGDIPTFTTVNTGTTILTATIEVTPVSPDCTGATETFTITVNPIPTVDAVGSQLVCNGDDTTLISFTGNAVAGVVYEWTNDNTSIGLGASGTGDIPVFTTTNTTNGQIIANLTVTPVANGCSGTAQNFTISVNPTPTVDAITSPAPYCTGDATAAIAFTGNGVAGTVYNWVNTGDAIGMGAMSGTGDIPAFTTVNTGNTILTATIEVTPVAGCSGTTETFTIIVNPIPTVDAVANQNLCNGDTFTAVNYTGNAVAGVVYDWTVAGDDVGFGMSGTGDIATYTVVNNSTIDLVATVTVTPSANGCSGATETFTITIFGTPDIVTPPNQAICDDDNDGFWIFDLTQDEAITLNGQDPAIFEVHYYSDVTYTTEILSPTNYQNTLAYQPDEIFMQVLNINTGCTSAISANPNFAVEVFATPYVANAPMDLSLCDNDDLINAGSADFDLNALIPDLLGTQATDPLNSFNVTFHLTQPDADAGINAMASSYNLLTGDEITVFVRIENIALTTCVDTSASFLIHTYDSPVLVMDPSYFLCLNQGFVTITSPPFAGYQWLDSSGVVLGTNQTYDFTAGGTYSLVVNNADNCTDTRVFTVIDSENPIITDVVYTEFTENNTIKVFVKGAITNTIVDIDHFEYALDNGPFQDSNVFEMVTPGVHYVVVRDKNGCGETVPYEVVVLGYMYYFTPNADGDHDVWKVTALQYFPDSKLYIYDRQGKMIKMLTETDAGWDGLYNGLEMPATDYWFSLILRDGREYRRHFALKR